MADDFERWLHDLNDAFVASTTASLDIEEALTITKQRALRAARRDTEQPSRRVLDAINKIRDAAGATKPRGDVGLLLPATAANPTAYMNQTYDRAAPPSLITSSSGSLSEEESVKRRRLLAHGAGVMFGTAVLGADRGQWLPNPDQAPAPAPARITMTTVKQIEAATRAMRALDYQFGGGACYDAIFSQLRGAHSLIGASGEEEMVRRLFRALGDLHNLAGWISLDVGLLDASRNHFATALTFAKQSKDSSLLANIMYRIGLAYMHHRDANQALKWFQLGQIAACDSGSELDVSLLCGAEAWAYAMMGNDVEAMKLLGRSRDLLARANLDKAPDWAGCYNDIDMLAMIGTVHNELSDYDLRHAPIAISALERATVRYDETKNRSQAFALTMLATAHLREGDVDRGVRIGRRALRTACSVMSQRVSDRMKPLEMEAARPNNADSRNLARSIREYRKTCHRRPKTDSPCGEPGAPTGRYQATDPV